MARFEDDLLKVAVQLCPAGRGRPSHAAIRRCISTAYYAVFHALGREIARPYRPAVRPAARRLLDHGQARDVATTLQQRRQVLWLPGKPACDPCLVQFADHFTYLQLIRHQADYDFMYAPTKSEATMATSRARRALEELATAQNRCKDQLQAICAAMVAGPSTRKRMAS